MKVRLSEANAWQEVGALTRVASFLKKDGGAILYSRGGVEVFLSQADLEMLEQRLPPKEGAGA